MECAPWLQQPLLHPLSDLSPRACNLIAGCVRKAHIEDEPEHNRQVMEIKLVILAVVAREIDTFGDGGLHLV